MLIKYKIKKLDDFNEEKFELKKKLSITSIILRDENIFNMIFPFINNVIDFDYPYVDKIEDTYCAWEMFWNNGEGFKNYEDFIEYYDDDDIIVKDNFETFSNIGLNGWHLSTFVDLLAAIYPDAEINTIVVDKKIKFIW